MSSDSQTANMPAINPISLFSLLHAGKNRVIIYVATGIIPFLTLCRKLLALICNFKAPFRVFIYVRDT
jgi:hypothetical protein